MSNPTERYEKLCLEESLQRIYQYPIACKELSFILRAAYAKIPKNLQSLIFQHTLSAIRLLPEMQTGSAVAAAHLLLQSAEATFPKQKKSLVITEFKQAKVAHKRRGKSHREEKGKLLSKSLVLTQTEFDKSHREEKGPAQLPQDILVDIFGLLDWQSLISAGLVCRSWNSAANDNHLWELHYTNTIFFERSNKRNNMQWGGRGGSVSEDEDHMFLEENVISPTNIDWKQIFKRAYKDSYSKKLVCNRGYCGHCDTIVWLKNFKCSNRRCELKYGGLQIKPISPHQVVDYVMDGYISAISSSDSDSESDNEPVSRLWAYPRGIRRIEKNPIV